MLVDITCAYTDHFDQVRGPPHFKYNTIRVHNHVPCHIDLILGFHLDFHNSVLLVMVFWQFF